MAGNRITVLAEARAWEGGLVNIIPGGIIQDNA